MCGSMCSCRWSRTPSPATRSGRATSSRAAKGLTVEIDNTDAEGRLILADALARACEDKPALLLDFATLTGAARTALGPDIPPFFTNDEALAAEFAQASTETSDPIWRMPLWDAYEGEMDSADRRSEEHRRWRVRRLDLRRAVLAPLRRPRRRGRISTSSLGRRRKSHRRPAGGEAQALRASWAVIKKPFRCLIRCCAAVEATQVQLFHCRTGLDPADRFGLRRSRFG